MVGGCPTDAQRLSLDASKFRRLVMLVVGIFWLKEVF